MEPVKVSTRGDYAARALLSLALHESDRPTSVKEIAERTNLPQPYLEQILLAVKGAGLVRSKRGVGGGYVLARPPEEITVAEILAAVDGPLTTLMGEHDHCEGHCVLQEVWVGVSEEMGKILAGFTLAELVDRTRIGHPEVAWPLRRGRGRERRRGVTEPDAPGRSTARAARPPPGASSSSIGAAVGRDEPADDRQPEAGSAVAVRAARAPEPVEGPGSLPRGSCPGRRPPPRARPPSAPAGR